MSGWHIVCESVREEGNVHQGDYNISCLQMDAEKEIEREEKYREREIGRAHV